MSCIVCNKKSYNSQSCTVCHRDPICLNCIEYKAEYTQICSDCMKATYWCHDCDFFIALPGEDPFSHGYRCEGYPGMKNPCDALLCEYCSYGYYYFETSEDVSPPDARRCEKCRVHIIK